MNMHKNNESGFVAITVAATIMVILVLLTVGFTRVIQREQRQTLDRQLSRQALYAAESGINDVYSKLQANPNLAARKQTCDATGSDIGGLSINPVIDSNLGIEYTCVLYDKIPGTLNKDVSETESWILELANANGNPFTDITIHFGEGSGNNSISTLCANAGIFPASRPGVPPLLRIDITSLGTGLTRSSLIGNTDYLYVNPCTGGSVASHNFSDGSGRNGKIIRLNCTNSHPTLPCSLTVNGLSSASYMARIKPVYASADVEINGNDASGPAQFLGQFSIDVTAKASDVVRRLRATLPLREVEQPPEAVIQAFNGVCKKISVSPTGITEVCNP